MQCHSALDVEHQISENDSMRHRGILVEGDANLPGASSISCNVAGSFVRPRWAVLIANGLLAFGPSNRATLNDDRRVANWIIWILHAH